MVMSRGLVILIVIALTIYVYLVGKLSLRSDKISGLVLPLLSLICSIYFKLKPHLHFMENGEGTYSIIESIFMILAIIGVVIYIGVKYFTEQK